MQSNRALKPLLFEDFRLFLSYNDVNYGALHLSKPLFGSSVATCQLACSEFHFKLTRRGSDIVEFGRWRDGVSALAELYALYPDRARYFNQWQRALYPKFIIKGFVVHILSMLHDIYKRNSQLLRVLRNNIKFNSESLSAVTEGI